MNVWERWLSKAKIKMGNGVASHVDISGARDERALYALQVFFRGVQHEGVETVDRAIEAYGFPGRHTVPDVGPHEFVEGMMTLIRVHHSYLAQYAPAA
jgi:hypothetical protein